jgi:hypothetical protein
MSADFTFQHSQLEAAIGQLNFLTRFAEILGIAAGPNPVIINASSTSSESI